jgi:hypothetical protein
MEGKGGIRHSNIIKAIWRLSSFKSGAPLYIISGTMVEPPTFRKRAG